MIDQERCILCGAPAETVEHIVPQWLLEEYDVAPMAPDGAPFRTYLCSPSNENAGKRNNDARLKHIVLTGEASEPVAYQLLVEWATWQLLLLDVAQGGNVWPLEDALRLLRERFPCDGRPSRAGGTPRGSRIHAAMHADLPDDPSAGGNFVVLRNDPRAKTDPASGRLVGFGVAPSAR